MKNEIKPQLELWEKDTLNESIIKYKKLYEKTLNKLRELEIINAILQEQIKLKENE